MKAQFDHLVFGSFFLWADNQLQYKAEAYLPATGLGRYSKQSKLGHQGQLFKLKEGKAVRGATKGGELPTNLSAYYCDERQLMANGPVSECSALVGGDFENLPGGDAPSYGVPSGIVAYTPDKTTSQGGIPWENRLFFGDNGVTDTVPRIMIDFDQGRIIATDALLTGPLKDHITLSGHFAKKSINLYKAEDDEVQLVNMPLTLSTQGEEWFANQSKAGDNFYTAPAVFISYNNSTNLPFALGGEDNTRTDMRLVCLTENAYELDGLLSMWRDTAKTSFTLFPFEAYPFGIFSKIKTPPYQYSALSSEYGANKKMFIQRVICSKLYDKTAEASVSNVKIGFADFQLETARFPRVNPDAI